MWIAILYNCTYIILYIGILQFKERVYFQKFNQVPQNKKFVEKMGIILENYILFNNIFYFIFNFYGSIVDLQCCVFHM